MPIYKKPEEKAGETVTIRLTLDERRMLNHLSAVEEMTLTDFIRSLVARRAAELNITEPPPPEVKRRPGRPKKKPTEPVPAEMPMEDSPPTVVLIPFEQERPVESLLPSPEAPPVRASVPAPSYNSVFPEPKAKGVFEDLVVRFRNSFVHRADGTKRELDDTIQFLCGENRGRPIIPIHLPLSELTSERLLDVRQHIRDADARLAKKNLYLTYLRMMLHFAVKEPDMDLRINPSRELPPLSIAESNESRRFFTGLTE